MSVGCLDESTVAAFADARLPLAELGPIRKHARACMTCHDSVIAAFERSGIARPIAEVRLDSEPKAAERPPLAAGQAVGRYTVLGLVGRGGMGEVYAAYDPSLDRRVALKLMSGKGAARDSNAQERLTREAQAIARLSHPNVVVVHDVGTFEGQVFLAMEFVEGMTLAAWLVERRREWREVLATFIQAGRGLSAAHDAGLVHRDFKPQNVMVARDGTAHVMDFGLARRIDQRDDARGADGAAESTDPSLTRTGEILGTPLFMAPEQFAAGRIDARTDQFSFCVALYWALCGVHPFGGSSRTEISSNASAGAVTGPGKRIAAPSRIQKVLLRGLSANPDARWPSMEVLIGELSRDPRRRRQRVGWAALVCLLCVAVAASAVRLSQRARALCSAGPERLNGIWETGDGAGARSRRAQVRAAILKAGGAESAQRWESVASVLDRHVGQWLAAYRDACEATHVRGEQSEEVLDLRMACLNDNLDSTRALTELLSSGDRAVIEHAGEAAASLDDLGRCGAVEQIRSGLRPPRDPRLRKAVEEARLRLKEGTALRLAGELKRATEIADGVLSRPDVASFCPVQAEALLLKGMCAIPVTQERGLPLIDRAIETGERCGHDRVVAAGLSCLVYTDSSGDWAAAERSARLAAAVLARLGDDPVLEGWLANNLGALRFDQGRYEEGWQQMQRGLELKERVLGPNNLDVALSRSNIGLLLAKLGRYEEALPHVDEALRVIREWGGMNTVVWANSLSNKGDALVGLRRLDEAEACYKRAFSIFEKQVPEDSPELRDSLFGLATVHIERGDVASAIPLLERVIAAREGAHAPPTDFAPAQFKLAIALDRIHREPTRARDLASRALAAFAAQPPFEARRREVQAWLDARRAKP
jgi:tetratricopeptide (TPR) repeat protein